MALITRKNGSTLILSQFENGKECTLHACGTDDFGIFNVRCTEVMELTSPTQDGAKSRVRIVYADRYRNLVDYALIKDSTKDLLDAYNKAGLVPIEPAYRQETKVGSLVRRPLCFLRTLAQV